MRAAQLQGDDHAPAEGPAQPLPDTRTPDRRRVPDRASPPGDGGAQRRLSREHNEIRQGCDGEAGGGADQYDTPKDCGTRTGTFNFRLFYSDPSLEDEIVIPLPHPLPEKNTLKLEGNYYQWQSGEGPKATLDDAYIAKRGNGGTSTGQTILAWNLHLTRVK
jgi:hypothetical protein